MQALVGGSMSYGYKAMGRCLTCGSHFQPSQAESKTSFSRPTSQPPTMRTHSTAFYIAVLATVHLRFTMAPPVTRVHTEGAPLQRMSRMLHVLKRFNESRCTQREDLLGQSPYA